MGADADLSRVAVRAEGEAVQLQRLLEAPRDGGDADRAAGVDLRLLPSRHQQEGRDELMGARNLAPLMSSAKQDWGTPRDFYEWLSAAFGRFTLDVCADSKNAKCSRYFTVEDDGLVQSWQGFTWFCNPEFEHAEPWAWKCGYEGVLGAPGALVVPSRVDTAWWRTATESPDFGRLRGSCYVQRARTWWLRYTGVRVGVYHHDQRLIYEGGPAEGAPFPTSVVLYLPDGYRPRPRLSCLLGGRPPLTLGAPA